MTISNDPDEDADNLDDESLLEAYLGLSTGEGAPQKASAPALPDWPDSEDGSVILDMDPAVLAWFQTQHADWKEEINLVLRAWVDTAER